MRIGVVCVALLVGTSAVTGRGQSGGQKPETVARWHFAGSTALSANKDLPALQKVLALPASAELREVAANSFATAIAQRFTKSTDTNANNAVAALIRPLLPDLLQNESSFDLSARGAQDADWALAVKLPAARQADWNKNLTELAKAARMNVTPGENGWKAERDNYRMSFSPSKDWLLLQGGFGAPDANSAKTRSTLTKRLGKDLLVAEVNFPKIAEMWSADRFKHAPRLTLAVAPRKRVLRSEMEIEYPQPLNIKTERWNPPTELIHDPLIGFTAIQGISEPLSRNSAFRQLGAEKTPNQAFLWSQSTMAFTVFAAADVGNPGTVVSNIVSTFLPRLKDAPGRINVLTNRPGIIWRDLPVAAPFIEAANNGRSPFLVGGLFPITAAHEKPAPRELMEQLEKRNLIYYDWEITQERLRQWRPIWQFAQILQGRIFPPSASDRWIDGIMPLLGNTVTQVTIEKNNRLKLVRNSDAGLTALELVLLAHALDPNDVRERRHLPPGQHPPARRKPAPQPAPGLKH
jgi:hypothetical protein